MSCVSPLYIKMKNGEYSPVECGHCMQCRIKKQSQLKFLAERELLECYRQGKGASFVTLTYSDDYVPFVHLPTKNIYRGVLNFAFSHNEAYYTLCKKDIQDFNKRVRRNLEYNKIPLDYKVIYCGEYGGQTQRPHAHIIFIGLSDILALKMTSKCWKYGLCDVGPLSAGGIDYVTKYITKSETYDKNILALFSHCHVEPPFMYHSINLGKKWLTEHEEEIANNHFSFNCRGKTQLFPKYVRDFTKYRTGQDPYKDVNDFIDKTVTTVWKISGSKQTFNDYSAEQNILREQYLIASARSRGLNVNPEFLQNKHWLKPSHQFDRLVDKKSNSFEKYKSLWFNELKSEGKTISEIANIFKKLEEKY